MATALQKQLATIAASSTRQLDLKAQKSAHGQSLLFEPKVAGSQSFESLFLICHDGFRELCGLDGRFRQFATSLFSAQSPAEDRLQMAAAEVKRLDAVLEAFLTLVGPRLLLKPAQKALEWLVRRFRVHEHNTETLVLVFLPYHHTAQFVALLSILPAQPRHALRFLFPYIQAKTNPPRQTLVYTAINTPDFFNALQSHMVRVLAAGHESARLLHFWASVTYQAIHGILSSGTTGRRALQAQKTEDVLLRVLPVLNSSMRLAHGPDVVVACYLIVHALVTNAQLGDKVLDGLMDAMVRAHDADSLTQCILVLAAVAEQRSSAHIPGAVATRLLKTPQLSSALTAAAAQCSVGRLALGLALAALSRASRSDEKRATFADMVDSKLLTASQTQIALSTLLRALKDSALGSEEHAELLELAAKLAEDGALASRLHMTAKENGVDLESLGLSIDHATEDALAVSFESEDEDMADADDGSVPSTTPVPSFHATSFLDPTASTDYNAVAAAFEQAVACNQTARFLASPELQQNDADRSDVHLTLLARTWSTSPSAPVRVAALRAAASAMKRTAATADFQNVIPYLVHALCDTSSVVRRSAAACIATLSKRAASKTPKVWGSALYGNRAGHMAELSADDASTFLTSVLSPVLEECVMDSKFVIPAVRDVLEGSTLAKSKQSVKAPVRTSVLAFLSSHVAATPLLRVRVNVLPVFNFAGKISASVRNDAIVPLVQQWSAAAASDVAARCADERISVEDADKGHLNALLAKEPKSAQLLGDIISGTLNEERVALVAAAFDQVNAFWPLLKTDARLPLAQTMLHLSLKESTEPFDQLCKERALETLRNVKLDSTTLVTFLDSVPSALPMPDGPPSKKRRRTSRSEMARVDVSSTDELQRLLRRLTLVLELIEGSNPGSHPELFRNLFNVFGDLQPLKQQSGSELVYLQSMILGALTPMVNFFKEHPETTEYQSAVRADLLIDAIRHSTSPQVQNSALLLISNLATWVPDLILHNLMPIFTFIGSTLLRQQDDYSAQVVDKTISRVVPQLAASLRAKHKNFLTGVSDLLLSFTAAFEHIPLHRRLKLFSELARTLGPEDSLSAVIALLADRYHNTKTQRRFSTELLLVFEPLHTLDAIKGYLDLVADAAGPKRKVSDTLFGLNEKKPAEVESAIQNLLVCLADLAADDRLRTHVTKAFRRKSDNSKPRQVFASIVEVTIQLSRQVASTPKLYECCSRVLARSLDLLPSTELVKSAELLLAKSDAQVQVAAIKSVQLRAASVVQNDRYAVQALVSFLPSVEAILQKSASLDAKIISVSCIDSIVERFGKKDASAVASVAQTIAGPQSLSHSDDRVRVLSLLCLTSIVDVLEDDFISLLPSVLPVAFDYLSKAIDEENVGLHNAVYTLISDIIERLGYMFSREYLDTTLRLSHTSAAADLEEACDDSRRAFYQSVSEHLGAQEVFAAIQSTWSHAVSQGFDASLEHLELLRSTVDVQTKAKLIKSSSTLFNLILSSFNLRTAVGSQKEAEYDDEEVEQLENTLVESALAMVLKLNDATFRPFFAQLVEQEGPVGAKPERAITFYRFLAAFFDKFKSIVTPYSSYIIDHAATLLSQLVSEDASSKLRSVVLSALQKTFQHDQDGFWQSPSHYGAIMAPLLALLTITAHDDVTTDVIPCITELAAASASSLDNHREMNAVLLKYMRDEAAHTRLATVLCEQSLTNRLGEEWLGLLPEMLPFISELREDDDEIVERETQRWISSVEAVLGEDLEGMLQ
ncbi:U3 small nucleolar RNA-associated protein 10 [Didymella exigua CBS 183.55]|uniref:U3 small nucleolar RNA-associated protein 10 n=1 Tax=Didymella exigua CBS 183.55 TaxID=1150837 RepID=A0A6A5R6S9_9PLEO|nr:U3 small nucleolar RNA-associated protein 10 [Didymella exigua CBS 183.55]KAF1922684.1 U3 small nucleolar RNA-associated protein 10 [Didymella exigua CBS 183.55]